MGRLRALGNIERGCWLIDQTAPMNVLAVAQVQGRLNVSRLAGSLERLQRRHPLLRVCVQVEGGVPFYVESDTPIPFAVIDRRDSTHFHQVVTDERNRPLRPDRAPLLRLTVLHGERESDLIFTMHHLILDGASSTYILRDLLWALAGQTPATALAPLPLRPALEDLMPGTERGLSGLRRGGALSCGGGVDILRAKAAAAIGARVCSFGRATLRGVPPAAIARRDHGAACRLPQPSRHAARGAVRGAAACGRGRVSRCCRRGSRRNRQPGTYTTGCSAPCR